MIGFAHLQYLSVNGLLGRPGCRMLDIGTQNLMNITLADARWFVERHGTIKDGAAFEQAAVRIAYFATPRSNEETTYLSHLIDLTNIEYTSYDVCPGRRTTIFDLNADNVPAEDRGAFDAVLNMGTTEHVINQAHAFGIMHDAMRVGGVSLHQVPAAGWTTHGYFAYRPQFFRDLAAANGYDLMDMWYNQAGQDRLDSGVDIRRADEPLVTASGLQDSPTLECLNYNINALIRKQSDAPFRWGLELATSHTAVSPDIARRYSQEGKP